MPRLEPFPDPHNDYRTPELSAIFGKIVKDALESTLLRKLCCLCHFPPLAAEPQWEGNDPKAGPALHKQLNFQGLRPRHREKKSYTYLPGHGALKTPAGHLGC